MSLQLTTNLLTFLEESKIAADGEWAWSVVLPHKSNTVPGTVYTVLQYRVPRLLTYFLVSLIHT